MEVKTFFFRDHHDFGKKNREICTVGPSIISIDRIWAVIKKKRFPITGLKLKNCYFFN